MTGGIAKKIDAACQIALLGCPVDIVEAGSETASSITMNVFYYISVHTLCCCKYLAVPVLIHSFDTGSVSAVPPRSFFPMWCVGLAFACEMEKAPDGTRIKLSP